ncbi:MAG: response regulator [Planctomycetota bacterium]
MRDGPLTTGEIAAKCHVSSVTVFRWIKTGLLKAYSTPGGHYRVERKEFLAFLRRQGMPVPPDMLEEEPRGTFRILIVDDEPAVLDLVKRALDGDGPYEIETAQGGYEACIKIGARRPDLVILDIVMPGVNGFEVCREIKQNPETSNCRILVLTGYPDESNIKRILEYGADRWLRKPLEIGDLREEVASLLGIARSGAANG